MSATRLRSRRVWRRSCAQQAVSTCSSTTPASASRARSRTRERGRGRIVQISSLAGRIGVRFQGAYSASKFALEGLSEALARELRPFGIDVVLVQPGDERTPFGAARRWTDEACANPLYRERAARSVAAMEQAERAGPPPERVAQLVARIVAARHPRLRYVCTTPLERGALVLQRLLPSRLRGDRALGLRPALVSAPGSKPLESLRRSFTPRPRARPRPRGPWVGPRPACSSRSLRERARESRDRRAPSSYGSGRRPRNRLRRSR